MVGSLKRASAEIGIMIRWSPSTPCHRVAAFEGSGQSKSAGAAVAELERLLLLILA
jgi:hypothetical protein